MRSSVPSQVHRSKSPCAVERGGRSFGMARHWHPVLRMYISPLTTSRTFTVLVAAVLRGPNEWPHMAPFLVRQIARITQFAAVVPRAVLVRPHRRPLHESGRL